MIQTGLDKAKVHWWALVKNRQRWKEEQNSLIIWTDLSINVQGSQINIIRNLNELYVKESITYVTAHKVTVVMWQFSFKV
jgi:hypothetical protein